MTYETLDDGAPLTDEAVDKLVADSYAALERGAYKVIPNPHKRQEQVMEQSYTYWEAREGGYIGCLNQYPDYWTQGDSVEGLKKMLASLYNDIMRFDDVQPAVPERTGLLAVPV